jgi:hypothetical protein
MMSSNNIYDFADRGHEKESARQEDAQALQESRVSLEQLRAANEPFRQLVSAGARVNLLAAQSLH